MGRTKRKGDTKQQSLEETTEEPVVRKRSKKGDLANPEVEHASDGVDDLIKRKQARKHQGDPAFEQKEPPKKSENNKEKSDEVPGSSEKPIIINRAPTLTLWVSAVAQREGHSRDSGMTFGKAIAGILAQSKGQSIGIYQKQEGDPEAKKVKDSEDEQAGIERIGVFGMTIKAVKKDGKYFATESGSAEAMDPKKVDAYLKRAFKERLSDAELAFQELANSFKKEDIGSEAYHLYEQFRPQVASGQHGWGRKGELDLKALKDLHSK